MKTSTCMDRDLKKDVISLLNGRQVNGSFHESSKTRAIVNIG